MTRSRRIAGAYRQLDDTLTAASGRSRGGLHGLGFQHRTGVSEEARLGQGVLRGEGRAARPRVSACGARTRPRGEGLCARTAAGGQGPGPLGDLPRRGTRRPRLRATQTRSAQRGHRTLRRRPAHVRGIGAGHRQHGDARRLRHRGAEGALAQAAAQSGHLLGVFDDRTPGRQRPEPVQDPRRPVRRRVGDQRREVVHLSWPRRRHSVRDVYQRNVRRAAGDPGRGDHARTAQPQPHRLPRCAGAARPPSGTAETAQRYWRSADLAEVASTTRCAPSRSATWPST